MDHSSPGSSVHGISQARILEWVAISFSRGSSQEDPASPALAGRFITTEPPGKPYVCRYLSFNWDMTCKHQDLHSKLINKYICITYIHTHTHIYLLYILYFTIMKSEDTYYFHNSFYFLSSWLENSWFALATKPKPSVDKGMKRKTCTKGDKPVSLSHPSVAWKCFWGKKRL